MPLLGKNEDSFEFSLPGDKNEIKPMVLLAETVTNYIQSNKNL
jgi:hypothetical protein